MSGPSHLDALSPIEVELNVNGESVNVSIPAHRTLLDTLRDEVGLTGCKKCCADGECGACSVMLDGMLVNSCLVLGVEAEGRSVSTIEGMSVDGLTDLQEEFLRAGAVQCGVCIPGQIMAADALLTVNASPSVAEIREAMSGNLCRCAGYERIVEAVTVAIKRRATP